MLCQTQSEEEDDESDEQGKEDVEDGGENFEADLPRRADMTVFLKAFLITAAGTYPFIVLVSTLSSLDVNKFVPCNERNPCGLVRIIGDEYIPSTINFGKNPFVMVKNGYEVAGNIPANLLSPQCPGKSSDEMATFCNLPDVKKSIINTMSKGSSKVAYVSSIIGWFLFKLLHDFLLLCGVKELVTLQVGLASVAFQLLAVASAFIWSMGAAEVFVAPISSASCGCYYQLGEIETLVAIATPVVLYKICLTKMEAITRAAIAGDFLYFMQYDVPHYLVTQSISNPAASFLVATTRGSRTAQCRPEIPLHQLRNLFQCYRMVDTWLSNFLQNLCVAVAALPLVERLMELGISHGNGSLSNCFLILLSIMLLAILTVVATYYYLTRLFDLQALEFNSLFWHWTPLVRCRFITIATVGSILLWVACVTLIIPLFTVLCGGVVDMGPDSAFSWGAAGFACFFFGVYPVIHHLKYPANLAFAMKARMAWPAIEYMRMAERPEFGCAEEVELAAGFLQKSLDTKSAEAREKEWKQILKYTDGYTQGDSAGTSGYQNL